MIQTPGLSRNIEKLAAEFNFRGLINVRIWWEPITKPLELCGHGGGWMAEHDWFGVEPLGYNIKDALHHVKTAPWLGITQEEVQP